jgi:hypothetical protein
MKKSDLPFVKGFALQNYLPAEKGIIEADKHKYHYWYIDISLEEERPSKWNKKRINHVLNMIDT